MRRKKRDGEPAADGEENPRAPAAADGRDGSGRLLCRVRLEAAGVRKRGKAGVAAGPMEKLPGIIETLVGAIQAGEADPMLEKAKPIRPTPKKKAA